MSNNISNVQENISNALVPFGSPGQTIVPLGALAPGPQKGPPIGSLGWPFLDSENG